MTVMITVVMTMQTVIATVPVFLTELFPADPADTIAVTKRGTLCELLIRLKIPRPESPAGNFSV